MDLTELARNSPAIAAALGMLLVARWLWNFQNDVTVEYRDENARLRHENADLRSQLLRCFGNNDSLRRALADAGLETPISQADASPAAPPRKRRIKRTPNTPKPSESI